MHGAIARVRSRVRLVLGRSVSEPAASTEACSWDELRRTYQEQAARGVPEAVIGLELMEQGRWPSSGRPRAR